MLGRKMNSLMTGCKTGVSKPYRYARKMIELTGGYYNVVFQNLIGMLGR